MKEQVPKVSIVKCDNYDSQDLGKKIKQSINLIGGIEKFVKTGQKVLIKPNLLKDSLADQAVTTHPEFVRAVIRLVKEQTDRVFVGDSPGGVIKAETVYEKCQIKQLCKEEEVELVKFDRVAEVDGIPFAKIKDEVDICISLPKFKTHELTTITAGIKNVFGLIPGLHKAYCHKNAPNFKAFSALLAKVYSIAKPGLTIVDAVLAMEGEGPSAGMPRKMGLVLASGDGVAIDAVLSKIIGLNPFEVMSTKEAYRLGLGQANLNKIDVLGEPIKKVLVKDFKLPKFSILYRIPNWITQLLLRLIPLNMRIDNAKCDNCLMCKDTCPEQAIKQIKEKLKIDNRRCTLCFCCGEICPNNAVYLRFITNRSVKF